eukprot:2150807-Rhodomonas_salina.4
MPDLCGTEIAYGATRGVAGAGQNLVLAYRVLCDALYRHSVRCYAMCGTGIVYGAMQCAVLP